ncbi:MAG: phosphohydrolase [Firmicutes bacterium HGW-Firmicutes-9]|jgi:PAS domain S-box-containing protein|nr:MAG: phosphohydrolase [Firmicutes bacterium HGW-Firmicutes-9]
MEREWLDNLYRLVLQQTQDGIILSDADGVIVFVNDAAERIRNIQRENILGHSMVDCHKETSREKVNRALGYLKSHEGNAVSRMVTDSVNDKYYENIYTPVFDETHTLQGVSVISRDITERRRAEESKAAIQRAQEVAHATLMEKYHSLMMTSMEMLTNLLEARDFYTNGHSKRVCEIATKLFEHRNGIDEHFLDIQWAAKLHDIGKICIPDAIVHKPGKLTSEEYETIKMHSALASDIIRPLDPGSRIWPMIRYHHERYDGKGYPDGRGGEEIPDGARVIAIADTYDAMRSCRPYRSAMSFDQCIEEIKANAGTQFDPKWVKVFLELATTGSID